MRQKLSELGKLIDIANSSQIPSDYQNAVDFAVDTFNIDVSNTVNQGIYYAPNALAVSGSNSSEVAGVAHQNSLWVAVGDLAFENSPGFLLSVIQHELAHINRAVEGRACSDGFWTLLCSDLDELEAYTIEYSYAQAYQLTEQERLSIEINIEARRRRVEKYGFQINPSTGMPYLSKQIVPSPRDIPKSWLPPSPL